MHEWGCGVSDQVSPKSVGEYMQDGSVHGRAMEDIPI